MHSKIHQRSERRVRQTWVIDRELATSRADRNTDGVPISESAAGYCTVRTCIYRATRGAPVLRLFYLRSQNRFRFAKGLHLGVRLSESKLFSYASFALQTSSYVFRQNSLCRPQSSRWHSLLQERRVGRGWGVGGGVTCRGSHRLSVKRPSQSRRHGGEGGSKASGSNC